MHLSIAVVALALNFVSASINSQVEKGMDTACKVCPWQKCINTKVYPYFDSGTSQTYNNVTLECWTRGENVGGSDGNNIWLGTVDNCYVTQYDLVEYNGTYGNDLPYCGRDSEKEFYTTQNAATKYDTECQINPDIPSDNVQYLPPNKDFTATCWTNGVAILDDDIWVRTTDLCYAAQIGLHHKIDTSSLDNCGPVPSLQVNYTGPYAKNRRAALPAPLPAAKLQPRYLINVTVGEDFAHCYTRPLTTTPIVKSYPWMESVLLQCITDNKDPADPNNTYWELTTDFCYVRSADFWESPEGDFYKFPSCSKFGQE